MGGIVCLDNSSKEIIFLNKQDAILRAVIDKYGPLTYRPYNDYFVFLINTIIGQMLSNKIGELLFNKLKEKIINIDAISIIKLGKIGLINIGISSRKAEAIINLSTIIHNNPSFLIEFESFSDDIIISELTKIKGIGPWTAKMFLIFCLNRPNVLPYEDGAFVTAFQLAYDIIDTTRDKRIIRDYCKIWAPYSSIAARYLYKAYDSGLLK